MKKNVDFDAVADLYDYYVKTDMDIGFYLRLCRGCRNILELMCGTGRVSLPLIREGFRLTCVDYAQRMLDVFRSKLKESDKADIICQDICSLYNPAFRIKSADGNLKVLGSHGLDDGKTLAVSFYNNYSDSEKMIHGMQFYEIYDEQNRIIEKRMLGIRFSVISRDEMLETAESTGFVLKEIYGGYDKQPFDPESPFMNFLFQKKSQNKQTDKSI